MTGLDLRALRTAFGSFLSGVTVVAATDPELGPVGFTANSFTSVSLDPPLLLVCPGRHLSSFSAFERCSHFAVSVLAETQTEVSNIFAGYKGDRFAKVDWHTDGHGSPLIHGAAACFSCRTSQVVPAGDHVILLGEVTGFDDTRKRGLGFAAGAYFSLGLEREAASAPRTGAQAVAGAIVEFQDGVLLEETADGLRLPQVRLAERSRVRPALETFLAEAGLSVELGPAYSLFDDGRTATHYTYFRAEARTAATGGLGRFLPISSLADRQFVSKAHAAMLARYANERPTRTFGLYVGDESGGEIHPVDTAS